MQILDPTTSRPPQILALRYLSSGLTRGAGVSRLGNVGCSPQRNVSGQEGWCRKATPKGAQGSGHSSSLALLTPIHLCHCGWTQLKLSLHLLHLSGIIAEKAKLSGHFLPRQMKTPDTEENPRQTNLPQPPWIYFSWELMLLARSCSDVCRVA